MKKLLQWTFIMMAALFIMPGKTDRVLAARQYQRTDKSQRQNKVLILVKTGETRKQKKTMKKITDQIREKTKGSLYEIDSRGNTVNIDLEQYDLILLGGIGEKGEMDSIFKNFLEKTDFSEKRISPFWLERIQDGEAEEENYEKEFQETTPGAICLPGLGLTGLFEKWEEENGRIDGWLTTAFTLRNLPEA